MVAVLYPACFIRHLLLLPVVLALQTTGPEAQGFLLGASNTEYTMPIGVNLKDGQAFEYIVVGAGAAGTTVAARLALAGADVLLVEAGGDPSLVTKIPGLAMGLLGSSMDWQYLTQPNNMSCLSSQGAQCRSARGKCLGGSTSINYMLYTRGSRQDYDDIGVPGWSYVDLLPYFRRSEGLQDLHLLPETSIPYHNTTGVMKIGFFSDAGNSWHSRLINAYRSLQIPFNPDINGKMGIGVTKLMGYVYKGERMSTARAYLSRDDVKRKLKVAKHTMCTGVIIDEEDVARGITVVQDGRTLRLYARREVILSAGTIGTPQILMLSGVGPANHLKSMGIRVHVDLPVGDNMSDHVLPLMVILVDKGTGLHNDLKELTLKGDQLVQLLTRNQGPLTSNGLTDVSAFINTDCYDFEQRRLIDKGPHCQTPNLQLIHAYIDRNLLVLGKNILKHATGFDDNIIDQLSKANEQYALLVVSPVLLQPLSRGRVRLASADPLARPAIYPNYLSEEDDVEQMVKFTRIVRHATGSRALRRRGTAVLRLRLAGCPPTGEAYWRCYARHMTFGVYHSVGTCGLGSVLDERLRVRGVHGLRVADASAMPTVPRSSTEAIALAIGEKLVDFLREDNGF